MIDPKPFLSYQIKLDSSLDSLMEFNKVLQAMQKYTKNTDHHALAALLL